MMSQQATFCQRRFSRAWRINTNRLIQAKQLRWINSKFELHHMLIIKWKLSAWKDAVAAQSRAPNQRLARLSAQQSVILHRKLCRQQHSKLVLRLLLWPVPDSRCQNSFSPFAGAVVLSVQGCLCWTRQRKCPLKAMVPKAPLNF